MKTILENPLFRVTPSRTPASRAQTGKSRLSEDPTTYFDGLAAAGLVDTPFIAHWLKYQLSIPGKSSSGEIRESMRASKAGSKVVSWWWSVNGEARKQLFVTPGLTASLLKFMVVEGLQDTIMQWLRMLVRRDLGGHNGQVSDHFTWQILPKLLINFMVAERLYGRGLISAAEGYVQACKMLLSMSDPPYNAQLLTSMRRAGGRLGYWIVRNERDEPKDIPAPLFESYTSLVSTLSPTSPPRGLLSASLPLFHPTHPDTRPLMDFARSLRPGDSDAWNDDKRRAFIKVGFEALRILTEQGASRDASYLAGHMQQLLPKEAPGVRPKPSVEEDYLLDRLELGAT